MKKLGLFIMMLLPMCSNVSALGQNKAELRKDFLELTDTLTTEEKDSLFSILNSVTLDFIDYNLNEGCYFQALEFMDSLQGNWKYLTGQDVPTQIYFKKALVLVQFSEWFMGRPGEVRRHLRVGGPVAVHGLRVLRGEPPEHQALCFQGLRSAVLHRLSLLL